MAKRNITIGILAHVDAGKTTLSEALLFVSGKIGKLGRVDCGDTTLDNDSLEKSRGITIFSKQTSFEWDDVTYYLLDTPGHIDFAAETERTFSVLDYAILLVSARDGIQSHTKTLWKLLRENNIPTFIFVNKMDLSLKKEDEIILDLQSSFGKGVVDFTQRKDYELMMNDEEFVNSLTLGSEYLTDYYFQNGFVNKNIVADCIKKCEVFPTFFGSALKESGIIQLLTGMNEFMKGSDISSEFGARVYKISQDQKGERLTFVKITGGRVSVKEIIGDEKINEIRLYTGNKFIRVKEAYAGIVCCFTGLSNTYCGQGIGKEKDKKIQSLEPILTFAVEPFGDYDKFLLMKDLEILEEEDPSLNLSMENNEIKVSLMGKIQQEILEEILKTRFGHEVKFGRGRVIYKETLAKGTVIEGAGHFEPLRHYAEVHLLIESLERGSGIILDSICSEDELAGHWQRLIISHIREKVHKGSLIGGILTDVKITLLAGKSHKKHTEGGDFREAAWRALRQGILKARDKGLMMLLEPWLNFHSELSTSDLGRLMADIKKLSGEFDEPVISGDKAVLEGRCPADNLESYITDFISYTGGNGILQISLDGYDICHNLDEVITNSDYTPERDIENTGDSVFCIKGKGKIIPWYESDTYMDISMEEDGIRRNIEEIHRNRYASSKDHVDAEELKRIFEMTYGPVKVRHSPGKNKKAKELEEREKFEPLNSKRNEVESKTKALRNKIKDSYVIIDGYNLIYAWDELKELSNIDFGSARERLIDILCNYKGYTDSKVIVVFDAYKVKGGLGSTERIRNIDVVYTKEAETADMYIEKVTHEMSKGNLVRVVTSDALEQLIILGHGAIRTSSREFIEEIGFVNQGIREIIRF